jgi:hypothetical protein
MGCSVGFWQSCSGCTDGVDGFVNPKHFPTHPKHGVPTGMGCDECRGKGVVFQRFTKADARAWEEMAREVCEP